jgi:uncharacterized membrane protein YbhN (UPF0104 family)
MRATPMLPDTRRRGMSAAAAVAHTGRRRLMALGRCAIAFAILAYLFRRISPESVLDAMTSAAPGTLLAAFLLGLLAHLAIADRLRRLVQALGMRLATRTLLQINLATVFYALVLPAGNVTGIIARFYRISRREPNYAAIAVALAFERLIATLTLCLVGVVFWLLDWPADWPPLVLMVGALAALLTLHAALFAKAPVPVRLSKRLGDWWPERLRSLRDALRRARGLSWRVVAKVFGLSILTHALGVFAYGVVASGLDLDLALTTVAWTRSAAVLVAILPISVAGLGVREGAMVILLAPYGVAAADALAYALLAFATTIVAVGILGGLLEAVRLLQGER